MRSFYSNRGSVLIVALIFAAILAISLTSYLNLSISAGKLSNRAFHMNAAQNLVDTGFERALWSLNNAHLYATNVNWTTGGFAEITGTTPPQFRGTFPSSSTHYALSGGAKGQVKVWASVSNYTGPTQKAGDYHWQAVAQSTVTLGDGSTLSKMAKAYLQQRSYSDGGMVSRNGMSFNGAVQMDSWRSRGSPYNPLTDIKYSTAVRSANAQISSPALINLQNADVYGYVSIGTSTITSAGIDVGPQGRVQGTFPGVSEIDPTRVTCNFYASFPDVIPADPGSSIAAITSNTTLASGNYTVSTIDLQGNSKDLHIGSASSIAEVTLTVTGNIALGGGAKIYIYPHPTNSALRGSSLRLNVAGDIAMGGGSGIQNGTATVPNNPDCFTLLGLRTEAQVIAGGGSWWQDWDIRGNGYLSCVIFAPNANVDIVGNADTYGSLVGNRVDIVGTGAFHQDLSLEDNRISGLWGLLKWRELYTASDRAVYAANMNF